MPTPLATVRVVDVCHRASGDRSHKHSHYLKGSLYCACGKRLGYGRHRGKCGGTYAYFSCLSRVQRGGRCPAPYFPVEATEQKVADLYAREPLNTDEIDQLRADLRAYVAGKAEIARREADRHRRRLDELTAEQQKLLQFYYRGKLAEEVFDAEKRRIDTERALAERWTLTASHEVQDVDDALEEALKLFKDAHVNYAKQPTGTKRLINQAIYDQLIVHDADTIEGRYTPLYADLARYAGPKPAVAPDTRQTAKRPQKAEAARPGSQKDPDPFSRGRGSYVERMAGMAGKSSKSLWPLIRRLHDERFGATEGIPRLGPTQRRSLGCA